MTVDKYRPKKLDDALNHYKNDPNVGKVFIIGGAILVDHAIKHKNLNLYRLLHHHRINII